MQISATEPCSVYNLRTLSALTHGYLTLYSNCLLYFIVYEI